MMSLEDLVRRDIEKWLGETDYTLSYLKNPDKRDDLERLRKDAARGDKRLAFFLSRDELIEMFSLRVNLVRKCLADNNLAAAYEVYMNGVQLERQVYKCLTLPDANRGGKVAISATKGHEAVYGSAVDKRAEYQKICDALLAEMAKGTPKAAAVVAERFGISESKVYRAQKTISKID